MMILGSVHPGASNELLEVVEVFLFRDAGHRASDCGGALLVRTKPAGGVRKSLAVIYQPPHSDCRPTAIDRLAIGASLKLTSFQPKLTIIRSGSID